MNLGDHAHYHKVCQRLSFALGGDYRRAPVAGPTNSQPSGQGKPTASNSTKTINQLRARVGTSSPLLSHYRGEERKRERQAERKKETEKKIERRKGGKKEKRKKGKKERRKAESREQKAESRQPKAESR